MSTKSEELKSLRIDRSRPAPEAGKAGRIIKFGVALLVLLGLLALAYRWLNPPSSEVEVTRARAESLAGTGGGDIVLSAGGYIVAHHKISVNSKVTGRVAWIGVEKGDKVRQGQVLVRLEDQEFRANVEQARGAVESAAGRLHELQAGLRPQEIAQARHNLEQAKATLIDDRITLERTRSLVTQGILARQQLDDVEARFTADQQHVNALEQAFDLARLGTRPEQLEAARGAQLEAQGRLAYAQSQLDATLIRAPVSGTILDRTAEKGELITAQFASAADTGGPRGSVVDLADLNDLQVELDIAQDDFAKLQPRQRGVVTTDAYPDRKYDGVIAEIAPEANRQKATVQVKVQIQNPDAYLRPEENATVKFLAVQSAAGAPAPSAAGVLVPTAALRQLNGRQLVLIAYHDRVVPRAVTVTGHRGSDAVVEGLTGGESVITVGPPDLKDGDRVHVKGQS